MIERINHILESWVISEPALFGVACTHELVENYRIACPFRCGRMRIEFNPDLVSELSGKALEEALKCETIRILLKHPYERKPDQCCQLAISIGSNLVLGDNYRFIHHDIEKPKDFQLESGMTYEWYSRRIQEMLPSEDVESVETDDLTLNNAQALKDLSELWEEDELMVATINGIIDNIKSWGSIGGNFAEIIKASTKGKINWKNIFAGFRASILADKRKLSRMKPSRRYGFEQMGSVREFTTKLLVAVDVSGSISSKNLSYFYGVVNSAFKYGFKFIDVIEFDEGITKVSSLKKKIQNVAAIGRGGTSFNEPVLYAHENDYDGLVILTDGYAFEPDIPKGFKTRIIWVCEDQTSYDINHEWMEKYGRVCIIDLS